ncbi:MAG: ASKHA domain-containing protein [Lachnospiraceae bacterium]
MCLLGRPCLRGRRYQLRYACDRRSHRFLPPGSCYEGADSFCTGDPGEKPVGLCGSGIIDVICELFIHGIINAKGQIVGEGPRIRRNEYGIGSYVIAFKEDADSVKDVEITEVDIDNFIRAKGVIFSAINIMLSSLDFDVSMIDDVYVAGGIGSGINMKNAVTIGMLPDIPMEKYHYIGNFFLKRRVCDSAL